MDGHADDAGPPLPWGDDRLTWSDARLLGFSPMDRTHEAFYVSVWRLLHCDAGDAAAAIAGFEAHAIEHFTQEDGWMRDTGFPAADCHVQEHAAVLQSVREVRGLLASGQAGPLLLHDLAQHLLDWFPGHADYLDAALAAWMCKRTLGGQPVVVRRKS